jgi:hypothetical protein
MELGLLSKDRKKEVCPREEAFVNAKNWLKAN